MKRLLIIGCLMPAVAMAGLFDDDFARQQIQEVKQQVAQVEARLSALDALRNAQLDQVNQYQALRQELARLTGQIEVLSNQIETTAKQQREFYADLDNRIKRLEASRASSPAPAMAEPTAEDSSVDTATASQKGEEAANFDAALRLFEAGKYAASAKAFQNFLEYHPKSNLGPAAQFWIGNAYYAQQNDKEALAAYQKVVARWPANAKSAEALLSIARIHKGSNDVPKARKALETLIAKHPNNPSAVEAKKMLRSL